MAIEVIDVIRHIGGQWWFCVLVIALAAKWVFHG